MDFMNTTVQGIKDRWQDLAADFKEKSNQFVEAWKLFMNDCDSRDRKVEERKAQLLAEIQEYDKQLESLGSEYTAFMLENQEDQAATVKQQMTDISSRRAADEVLIGSLGKAAYSESLLQAAEEAYENLGYASMTLASEKGTIRDTLDDMLKELESLKGTIVYAGDITVEATYSERMYRRFNHQAEEGDRPVGSPAIVMQRTVVTPVEEYPATHRSGSRPYPVATVDPDL